MYNKKDKRRLYWLVDMYISGKIDSKKFCNEFYYSFDLEIDHSLFLPIELEAFRRLSIVAGRYSWSSEDLINYPNAFYRDEDLYRKVYKIKKDLKNYEDALFERMGRNLTYSFMNKTIIKFSYNMQNKIELEYDGYEDLINNYNIEKSCTFIIKNWRSAKSKLEKESCYSYFEKDLNIFDRILSMEIIEHNLEILVNTISDQFVYLFFEKPIINLEER